MNGLVLHNFLMSEQVFNSILVNFESNHAQDLSES